MTSPDLRDMLHRAEQCLTAAALSVHADADAALDDVLAARLLVASALLAVSHHGDLVG